MDGDHFFQDVLTDITGLARDFVSSGGLRVSVKTNLGPEIPVFTGQGQGGLAELIGFEAGVIVRDREGNLVTTYGNPPATDYVKAAILAGASLAIIVILIRGLRGK